MLRVDYYISEVLDLLMDQFGDRLPVAGTAVMAEDDPASAALA